MKRISMNLFSVALLIGCFLALTNKSVAENSSTAYEPHQRSYQVYIAAYNNGPSPINRDEPVILDIGNGTAGSTLGAYVTETATTDSIFAIGVADTTIARGQMGRICIKGPHKVAMATNIGASSGTATGAILSTSTTVAKGGIYSTADGTAGGQLGYLMSTTATSDTGDASNTYWFYIQPRFHK